MIERVKFCCLILRSSVTRNMIGRVKFCCLILQSSVAQPVVRLTAVEGVRGSNTGNCQDLFQRSSCWLLGPVNVFQVPDFPQEVKSVEKGKGHPTPLYCGSGQSCRYNALVECGKKLYLTLSRSLLQFSTSYLQPSIDSTSSIAARAQKSPKLSAKVKSTHISRLSRYHSLKSTSTSSHYGPHKIFH